MKPIPKIPHIEGDPTMEFVVKYYTLHDWDVWHEGTEVPPCPGLYCCVWPEDTTYKAQKAGDCWNYWTGSQWIVGAVYYYQAARQGHYPTRWYPNSKIVSKKRKPPICWMPAPKDDKDFFPDN